MISIIVPTFKRERILNKCIVSAIEACSDINYEIIIVNDDKKNDIKLDTNGKKIKVVNNKKKGVAAARNYGASLANGDWLLFLDDDMILFKENIKSYLSFINKSNEKICVNIEWTAPPDVITKIKKNSFGRFLIKYGFTSMRGWNNNPEWEVNSKIVVNSIASPNLFINKKHFFETSGYDEYFPYAGFEDYAFCKRLQKFNFIMYVCTTSMMYHNEEDRLNPKDWYLRKERGAETQKIAIEQGFSEIAINYSYVKKLFYFLNPVISPILKFILMFSSKSIIFDNISSYIYKLLLGISIYKGYTKR